MTRSALWLSLIASAPVLAADAPARHRGEFLQMWDAILAGSQMGPGDGWFKPGLARYTWARLAARFDKDRDGRVTAEELGRPDLFAALDRDGDGAITAADLDWSDGSPYMRQLGLAQQLIRRGDRNGDRKLSKEEWAKLFEQVAKGKDWVDAEAVRRVLFPPAPARSAKSDGGMPSKEVLLLGLLMGELGSAAEGPKLEAPAPDFTLKSPDGKRSVTLSDYRGKKPVVLIFGSFT
jgi:AhpC/TSA family/EF hand